jgi:RimJ/RimL family protein N-acetyltransferase
MPNAPAKITTARLLLRKFETADEECVYAYARDPEVTEYMRWETHTHLTDAREFIDRVAEQWRNARQYTWAITTTNPAHVIGAVSCTRITNEVSVSYVLSRQSWGYGYATEATRAILDWITSNNEVVRLYATCDVDNVRSARVLEKLGFSREAILQDYVVRPNQARVLDHATVGAPARDAYLYSQLSN